MSFEPVIQEKFVGDVFSRWQQSEGSWKIEPDVEISDLVTRDIYFAPQEPSFVSWATLWKEKDGAVKVLFTEAVGNQAIDPTYNFNSPWINAYHKILVSRDNGETWEDTGYHQPFGKNDIENSDHHCRSILQLPDGVLLRMMPRTIEGKTRQGYEPIYDPSLGAYDRHSSAWPFRYIKSKVHKFFPCFSRSYDGGMTWTDEVLPFKDDVCSLSSVHALRDGTIVAMGSANPSGNKLVLSESHDSGRTWSDPTAIVFSEELINRLTWTEEVNFAELPDARLLILVRVHAVSPIAWRAEQANYHQFFLKKNTKGIWEASEPKVTVMPPSGHPMVIRTSKDVLICNNNSSHFFSLDDGLTWKRHFLTKSYYAQMIELDDGKILCLTHTNGSDTAFSHCLDMSMKMTRFNYRKVGSLIQSDPKATPACIVCETNSFKDFHLKGEMRVDGCSSVVFRFSEGDKLSYYVYCLLILTNHTRVISEEKLGRRVAFAIIGKVEGKHFTTLKAREIVGGLEPGTWCEVQVNAEGSSLKGSVRRSREEPAQYICGGDESIKSGKIGFLTDECTGAFRNIKVWSKALLMRDLWSKQ